MSLFLFMIVCSFFKVVLTEHCICVSVWLCPDFRANFDESIKCPEKLDVCCAVNCGQRNLDSLPFNNIATNHPNNAKFAEFPWMLGIFNLDGSYICGGSLIHPSGVLTAAHCVIKDDIYVVRAGDWNLMDTKEAYPHEDRITSKIIIHPEFDKNSLINDIAFILLKTSFTLDYHIGILCLPDTPPTPNLDCIVSGWGSFTLSTQYSPILQKVQLPIIKNQICEAVLQKLLKPGFHLDGSFICTGVGKDGYASKGDGGSPLMCKIPGEENKYEQFGIVSWGLKGVKTIQLGVYVNVAYFIPWIDYQMEEFGLDHRMYKRKRKSDWSR